MVGRFGFGVLFGRSCSLIALGDPGVGYCLYAI